MNKIRHVKSGGTKHDLTKAKLVSRIDGRGFATNVDESD